MHVCEDVGPAVTEAEIILKMIETVDPPDTAKPDEIDALVWYWLRGATFVRVTDDGTVAFCEMGLRGSVINEADFPNYSRSRDALKAIRPEGWMFRVSRAGIFHGPEQKFAFHKWGPWECVADTAHFTITQYQLVAEAPTEELAELHAIIQAIAYERRNVETAAAE
jgi:hypothetical protein